MKVIATAAADSSGAYRITQPADALAYWLNLDIEVVPQKIGLQIAVHNGTVLQRPMGWVMPSLIDYVQSRGTAVVVELDDDYHTSHPNNKAFQLNHPRRNEAYNWNHLTECVKRADLVTVSTDQLARRYGSHGRVAVLRNCAGVVAGSAETVERRHHRMGGHDGQPSRRPAGHKRRGRDGVEHTSRLALHVRRWRGLCRRDMPPVGARPGEVYRDAVARA